ncbi:MAG: DUF169 domain-containing protein [Anaerolineae bacterium]|jgi:hypothetical protein
MDLEFKQQFSSQWERYFPNAALPIALYYTDDESVKLAEPETGPHCLICTLATVRGGQPLRLSKETIRCGGGKRYLGFAQELSPNFAYFLSCGIPDQVEGERYKRSPELVEEYMASHAPLEAPAEFIVFKRWDQLDEGDTPAVVVFFAPPDVLSGLFTLANFDEAKAQAVIAPFSSGCASIVYQPYHELTSDRPRAVLGTFDVSARPCVPADTLTFAIPWPKFTRMVEQMDESFLITASWRKVQSRM